MEQGSEKLKRGRPRSSIGAVSRNSAFTSMWPEDKTPRSRMNRAYAVDAVAAMCQGGKPPVEFEHIFGEYKFRAKILEALGRIGDHELIRAMAREICKHRLNTRDAVAACKRCRKVETKAGTASELVDVLLTAFNTYCTAHGGMDMQQGLDAAEWLVRSVRQSMDDAE